MKRVTSLRLRVTLVMRFAEQFEIASGMIALEGQAKERLVGLDDLTQSAFGIGTRERVENPVPYREGCLQ